MKTLQIIKQDQDKTISLVEHETTHTKYIQKELNYYDKTNKTFKALTSGSTEITSTYYYYRFSDRSDLYYLFGELDGIDVDNALIFLIHVPASFIYNWPTGSGARFIYKQK